MSENSFRFKKGELEIEFSGERNFVEEQIKDWKSFMQENYFSDDKKNIVNNDNLQNQFNSHNQIIVKKNITIDDFYKLKDPDNDVDKTIVAAYFLERYENYDSFTEQDISNLAKIENIERCLEINREKSFLSLYSNDNNLLRYTLTYSGEIYVREGLQEL